MVVQDGRDDWMRGGLLEGKYPSVLSSLPSSVIQRRENFFFGSLLAFQVFCFSLANSDPKNHALYRRIHKWRYVVVGQTCGIKLDHCTESNAPLGSDRKLTKTSTMI